MSIEAENKTVASPPAETVAVPTPDVVANLLAEDVSKPPEQSATKDTGAKQPDPKAGGENKDKADEPDDGGAVNLLAEDAGGQKKEDAGKPDDKPQEIDIDEFIKKAVPDGGLSIGKDSLGRDIVFSAEDAKVVAPHLAKVGLTPEQASGAFTAIRAYEAAKIDADNKAFVATVRALAEDSKAEFGDDLGRFVGEARKGGKALFGDAWEDLSAIPHFANDKRILRALAGYGRSISGDQGTQAPDGGGNPAKFSFDAWVKSSSQHARG